MDRQFYVKNDAGEIDSVSEKEISTLAYFASLLDFAPELKEHFGMDVQLRTFFAQNPNHEFSDSYSALSSTLEGNLLFEDDVLTRFEVPSNNIFSYIGDIAKFW